MNRPEIAITGIGVISAIGNDRESFWENCRTAKTGIRRPEPTDTVSYRSNAACGVTGFDPKTVLPPRVYRRMSRVSQMAVAASIEALRDSGLCIHAGNTENTAVIFGTADGPSSHVERFFLSLLKNGPRGTQPLYFPETVPNAPASHVAMYHGIKGPNTTFCQNMISFENAIVYAQNLLEKRQADIALVGGADELSEMQFACYASVGALNSGTFESEVPIVPGFGTGFFLGEGAAVLVLERTADAVDRGARIYGLFAGGNVSGGMAAIGHYGTISEQMEGNIRRLLSRAVISPDDIGQVSIAANFAKELDGMEYDCLRTLLGTGGKELPVSPLKYLLGEFGGVGAHRAAATLLSLHHRIALPTIDVFSQLPFQKHPPQWTVHKQPSKRFSLMNSATYGGGCACLLFTPYER